MTPTSIPSTKTACNDFPAVRSFLRRVEEMARLGAAAEEPEGVLAGLVLVAEQAGTAAAMLANRSEISL